MHAELEPGRPRRPEIGLISGGKQLKTARHVSPYAFSGIRKKPNDRPIQPHCGARGRRGHADALIAAKGAASGRRPITAVACAGCRAPWRRRLACRGGGARPQGGRGRGRADQARCGHLHSARAPRHRARGARGPRRDCPRRGRSSDRVRRYAADLVRDLRAHASAVEERRGARRARLPRRRSDRLRPAGGRGQPVDRDPRAGRREFLRNARSRCAMPA